MTLAASGTTLAVISDSHNEIARLENAAALMKGAGVKTVVHCGDITSRKAVAALGAFDAHWVLGNCDWDETNLREAMQRWGHTCHGLQGTLEVEGVSLAFTHGHRFELLRALTLGGGFDLVMHGHTHVRRDERENGTRILCPGALHHASPPGFVLLGLPGLEIEWVDVA